MIRLSKNQQQINHVTNSKRSGWSTLITWEVAGIGESIAYSLVIKPTRLELYTIKINTVDRIPKR